VTLVRTDVLKELMASIIRVSRIGEKILVTLMKEALRSSETSVLQEPQGATSQKMPFFN
jgi:hypothetical protein